VNQFLVAAITTACTVAVSLLVTYIFNKVSGVPKKLSDEKKARARTIEELKQKDASLESKVDSDKAELLERIEALEEVTSHYPEYRAQSLQIQAQLQQSDKNILSVCDSIKAIGEKLNDRLIELERREKNTLRKKILDEYRLYTDEHKNPHQA
jgi:septal ring factor EnvC (AmiA/AmiB activator)